MLMEIFFLVCMCCMYMLYVCVCTVDHCIRHKTFYQRISKKQAIEI